LNNKNQRRNPCYNPVGLQKCIQAVKPFHDNKILRKIRIFFGNRITIFFYVDLQIKFFLSKYK